MANKPTLTHERPRRQNSGLLENIQIMGNNNIALVGLANLVQQHVLRVGKGCPTGARTVIKKQELRFGACCYPRKLNGGGVVFPPVRLPLARDSVVRMLRISYRKQNITTAAVFDDRLGGRSVAGYYNGFIRGPKLKAKRVRHIAVTNGKCGDRNVHVLIDQPRLDLGHVHLAPSSTKLLG